MNSATVRFSIAVVLATGTQLFAQGYAPDEATSRMHVADGLRVELFAAEPLVRQPVCIEFDDRGRLWVIQYLQYPNPAGLARAKVDRYSRTVYDRVPEPPPHGPQGADRITILEDTNSDGRADESKDFLSGLNLTTGLTFGHGGVFVLNVPYLLFYPDRNADDQPDGDPEVLLSGFGMHDAHSVANSLTWGPDGWLYGCQGSTVTSSVRGIEFQQGVWRYHPLTHEFELFCEGGGNSWGLDFDSAGNLIYSTNFGGYVALYGMQGGYLVKSFGKHGALHNPYAFGYFEHISHAEFQGGHVTVGGIFYNGTTFPQEYRGKYIGGDLLGHAVRWHSIERTKSTFRSANGGELLAANDTWFAPSDVTLGPDGAVYVTDWHDRRTAHPDPDADWDRSNGRIYRVQAVNAQPVPHVDLHQLSSEQLVEQLTVDNGWYARRALRILSERRDAIVIPSLRECAIGQASSSVRLSALWALAVSDGLDEATLLSLLSDSDENIRAWAVRLAADSKKCGIRSAEFGIEDDSTDDVRALPFPFQIEVSPALAQRLADLSVTEPSDRVRAQLACTARRLAAKQALPILAALVKHDEDASDPCIPLLIWWGFERHAVTAVNDILNVTCSEDVIDRPVMRDFVFERLIKRYAAEGTTAGLVACARLIESAPSQQQRWLTALDEGLQLINSESATGFGDGGLYTRFAGTAGKRGTELKRVGEIPPSFAALWSKVWSPDTTDPVVLRISARLGLAAASERAVALVSSDAAPLDVRRAAIEIAASSGDEQVAELLLAFIGTDQPIALQIDALHALSRFDSTAVVTRLLDLYPNSPPEIQGAARDLLFSRPAWASNFVDRVEAGAIDSKQVPADSLRAIALHNNPELNSRVRKHWGQIRSGTPGEKLAEMRRLNNDLRAASGDSNHGRELYTKHCATCHRLHDVGNMVGPELTHANRKDSEFLLASLVDPSAQVRTEFLSFVVQTTDGRVLTGLLADQTPSAVTLLDAKNQRVTVPRAAIELMQESDASLMPENLLKPLSPQELRDLFAFLQQ